jgi:hypothetical protein
MKLRTLIIVVAVLVGFEVWAWRRDVSRREQSGGSALVDSPLLDVEQVNQAQRIVIREKPQSKLIKTGIEGFEMRHIVDKNAPIRETVLERRNGDHWVVANYFDLDVDSAWLHQTMRDLSQGRLTRYLTNEPKLMNDLNLEFGQVRLEDGKGGVIRQVDFGRKDGGDTYQFVRVDGKQAFVAKHETEIVGDPLAWIVTRVLNFQYSDIREAEIPFSTNNSSALLTRSSGNDPLYPADKTSGDPTQISKNAERILTKIISEPIMLAVAPDSPLAASARQHVTEQVRLVLFNGKQYKITYRVVPNEDPALHSLGDAGADLVFATFECSDPTDLTQVYGAKALLAFSKSGTVDRLPKDPAALAAAPPPPPPEEGEAAPAAENKTSP